MVMVYIWHGICCNNCYNCHIPVWIRRSRVTRFPRFLKDTKRHLEHNCSWQIFFPRRVPLKKSWKKHRATFNSLPGIRNGTFVNCAKKVFDYSQHLPFATHNFFSYVTENLLHFPKNKKKKLKKRFSELHCCWRTKMKCALNVSQCKSGGD